MTAPDVVGVIRSRWLPPAVALVVFLGLWYLVSEVVLDADRRFLLPPPHAVVEVAFLNPANRASLLHGLALSATVALVGFLVAAVLGVAIGTAMSQARWVERSLYPYAVLLQCVPVLALALTLSGCITHLGVRTREHLRIGWANGWDDAAARAQREQKPILMILVAGQIDGLC